MVAYSVMFFYRYKVKIRIDDGTSKAVVVLFDTDVSYLIEKKCAELVVINKVFVHFKFIYFVLCNYY
jgi:hypothetical protein